MTHRPWIGSTKKHGSVTCRITCILDHLRPPSSDVNMTWDPCVGRPTRNGFSNISANTYTLPVLSVRDRADRQHDGGDHREPGAGDGVGGGAPLIGGRNHPLRMMRAPS